MIYQKKVLDESAIYQFVRIEFIDGIKLTGWLIPYTKKAGLSMEDTKKKSKYILLSIYGAKMAFTRGCIKEIHYDIGGYPFPFEVSRRK